MVVFSILGCLESHCYLILKILSRAHLIVLREHAAPTFFCLSSLQSRQAFPLGTNSIPFQERECRPELGL
jgi:hypothetical protein